MSTQGHTPQRICQELQIPWPSSGKKRGPRRVISKGLIKSTKLSTKYFNQGKRESPCCSPVYKTKTEHDMLNKSLGQLYKEFYRERNQSILITDDNDSMKLQLSPSTCVTDSDSDDECVPQTGYVSKSSINKSFQFTDAVNETPVLTPQNSSDPDLSPSPQALSKRIERLNIDKIPFTSSDKTPRNHQTNNHRKSLSTTNRRSALLSEILSSSDEEILPLSLRIKVQTKSKEKTTQQRPNNKVDKTRKWRTPKLVSSTSSDSSVTLPKAKVKTLRTSIIISDSSEIESCKETKTTGVYNSFDSDSSFDRLIDKKLSVKKPNSTRSIFKTHRISSSNSDSSVDNKKLSVKKPNSTRNVVKTPKIIISSDSEASPDLYTGTVKTDVKKKTIRQTQPISEPVRKPIKNPIEPKTVYKTPEMLNKKLNFSTPKSPNSQGEEYSEVEANQFLASLSEDYPSQKRHYDALLYFNSFSSKKQQLSDLLYSLFNKHVFGNKLPLKMLITWKPRMTHTAGFCTFRKTVSSRNPSLIKNRTATIELSIKVLDSPDRLRDTLIHEMCHAATWIISGSKDDHHGNVWKNWCWLAASKFPSLPPIKTTHNYPIKTKFIYRCTQCKGTIGRHSKSLDMTRKVCGRCHGKFELLVNGKLVDDQKKSSTLTPFAKFVKQNYSEVKKRQTSSKHADVMKKLSKLFSEQANIK